MKFYIKVFILLFVCTAFVACSEEDRFGIGLERPEDAGLTEFQKRKLKQFRSESLEEMKERLKNSIFYRVKAEYSHADRKTGEVENIKFDFVAMCGGRVLMDAKGYTVSETDGVNPAYFFEPTEDDGLIMMRVPSACRSGEFVKKVPNDFTPFVVWFDDVHKLTHGLGYATEDAYESPVSQLKFVSASLERADIDAWLEWRENRLKTFKPIGFVKSPWGVSLAGNDLEKQSDELPKFVNFRACRGQRRYELAVEAQELLQRHRNNILPKFWKSESVGLEKNGVLHLVRSNKQYGGPGYARPNMQGYRHGILTRNGSGRLYGRFRDKIIEGEIYPKFTIRRVVEDEESSSGKNTKTVIQYINFNSELKGFVACGIMRYSADMSLKELGFDQAEGLYIKDGFKIKKINNFEPYISSNYFVEEISHLWIEEF